MGQNLYDIVAHFSKVRYATTDEKDALHKLLIDINRLRADEHVSAKRLLNRLTGFPDADWLDECITIALDIDREDLYEKPNKLETKRRFFDYAAEKLGMAPEVIKETWPTFINGAAYQRQDSDLEKPLDNRHFRTFFAKQGPPGDDNHGKGRQLELGL